MDKFLGHTIEYWIELDKKAEDLGVVNWLAEIAELRGKVSYYESRIEEMNKFKNK